MPKKIKLFILNYQKSSKNLEDFPSNLFNEKTLVIQGNIPITLILVGVILGLLMELLRLPILPFALGLYLPLSLSTSMMLGGIVSFFVKKREKTTHMTTASEKGILAASGLVAGDACTGVVIALLTVLGIIPAIEHSFFSDATSLSIFLLLALGLGAICFYKRNPHKIP